MIPDLTVGLISVLTDIVWRITVTWHAGNFCCKLIRFLQVGRVDVTDTVSDLAYLQFIRFLQ
jgi:hypothetical protein